MRQRHVCTSRILSAGLGSGAAAASVRVIGASRGCRACYGCCTANRRNQGATMAEGRCKIRIKGELVKTLGAAVAATSLMADPASAEPRLCSS